MISFDGAAFSEVVVSEAKLVLSWTGAGCRGNHWWISF